MGRAGERCHCGLRVRQGEIDRGGAEARREPQGDGQDVSEAGLVLGVGEWLWRLPFGGDFFSFEASAPCPLLALFEQPTCPPNSRYRTSSSDFSADWLGRV